jgi:hypothetical protein
MNTPTILLTSLAEIRSFNPCAQGWKDILSAHPHETEEDFQRQFPLVDCVESNTISDVCWLIGKRKIEIQICVRFARMCADSVKDLDTRYAADASEAAADAAASDAYAASVAAAYASDASVAAAYAAAYASDASACNKQRKVNKTFLIQCINEFTGE